MQEDERRKERFLSFFPFCILFLDLFSFKSKKATVLNASFGTVFEHLEHDIWKVEIEIDSGQGCHLVDFNILRTLRHSEISAPVRLDHSASRSSLLPARLDFKLNILSQSRGNGPQTHIRQRFKRPELCER